ncbi:hypothetical protein Tco_0519286 [Tanacetum coccineum]
MFKAENTEMPQNQGTNLNQTDDQPNVEAASKHDWFNKPKRPPTPDLEWNAMKTIYFKPPQTWISGIAKSTKPPLTFYEPMNTPIDFSAYVVHNLKIDNLTQQNLVGTAFNLLKGKCKSRVELKFLFEECYKAVNDRLDWTNPGGHQYLFDLSKPLPLIEVQGRQGIEDMVLTLWSPVKVAYDRYALWGISHWGPNRQKFYGFASHKVSKHDVYSRKRIIVITHVKVMKWYDYGYLEEIVVRREDQMLHKFKECDFLNLNLCDIEDMLLLFFQKKILNLERDVIFDLNVALRMFTRRVVIQKRVEDLQLGVKSYQKKLNITRPETFRSNISGMTAYTSYNNPRGITYLDKFNRNKLMRADELYKFCDGTLTSIRIVLQDIVSGLNMEYLPKIR